jgi:hypothetical protein
MFIFLPSLFIFQFYFFLDVHSKDRRLEEHEQRLLTSDPMRSCLHKEPESDTLHTLINSRNTA